MMTRLRRSALAAALLSFAWPGLGQAWAGWRLRGLLLALPAAAGLLAGAILLSGVQTLEEALDLLLSTEVLLVILALDAVILLYRSVAIVDAFRLARRRWGTPGPTVRVAAAGGLAVLLVATALMHGAVAYIAYPTYDFLAGLPGGADEPLPGEDWAPTESPDASDGAIWWSPEVTTEPDESGTIAPEPEESSGATPGITQRPVTAEEWRLWGPTLITPAPAPTPTSTPKPTKRPGAVPYWARDGRLNLLLVGGDAGPDRWSMRTDTMILLSVDLRTRRAALFGIPRNLVNVPLPAESARAFTCRCFPGLLNALYVYAMGHPDSFPGGASRGYRAVSGAVGELTGQRIDGMVVVNLRGFVQLVDAIGGLRITVPRRLYDSHYPLEDGSGWIVLNISPGLHVFNGRMALAYARSRHQDSDYGRMRRQQEVLMALRQQVRPCALLPKVPRLLQIAKDNLWTNIPVKSFASLVSLAQKIDVRRVARYAFTPPSYHAILTKATIARIRSVAVHAFDGLPAVPGPPPGAGGFSC